MRFKISKNKNQISNILLLLLLLIGYLVLAADVKAALLYFEPQTKSYYEGDSFNVELWLDTEGRDISGVDIVVRYPKEVLEIQSVIVNPIFSLYDDQVDNFNGILKIFGTMNSINSYLNGKEKLATLKLVGVGGGEGRMYISCIAGDTVNDSNVWEKGAFDVINCNLNKQANFLINSGCPVPSKPVNVQAVSGPSSGQVKVVWDRVEGADYYSISFGPSSENYLWGAPNLGNVGEFTVSGLQPGKLYYFAISAISSCGSSGSSQETSAYAKASSSGVGGQPSNEEEETIWQPSPSPGFYLEASPMTDAPTYWGYKPSPSAFFIESTSSATLTAKLKVLEKEPLDEPGLASKLFKAATENILKTLGIVAVLIGSMVLGIRVVQKKVKF